MKIKWIVLDMDGTLLDSNKELPIDFFNLKKQLEDKGVHFILASGRQYARMSTVVEPFSTDFTYLSDNGTNAYQNGKVLFQETIDPLVARRFIEIVEANMDVDLVVNTTKAAYFHASIDDETVKAFEEYYEKYELLEDLASAENITKITLYEENDDFKQLDLLDEFKQDLNMTHSGPTWFDAVSSQASKGLSLKRLADKYKVSPSEIMVFGDAMNDYDMLQFAGHPIVMANADPRLKKYGFRETKSNDENGVCLILEELLHESK